MKTETKAESSQGSAAKAGPATGRPAIILALVTLAALGVIIFVALKGPGDDEPSTGTTAPSAAAPTGRPRPNPAQPLAAVGALHITSKPLTEVIEGRLQRPTIQVSTDGRHIAFVSRRPGGYYVTHDGASFGPYTDVGNRSLRFSADGAHLGFVAKKKKLFAVIDGQAGPDFDNFTPHWIVMASTGGRWAYSAIRDGKPQLVIDGKAQPAYADISPDLRFSPDGKRLAVMAKKAAGWSFVIDGAEGRPYARMAPGAFGWAPGSKRFSYGAQESGSWKVIENGLAQGPYDTLLPQPPAYSADGSHRALAVFSEGQARMVIDGKPQAGFDGVAAFTFGPQGKRHAYLAKRGTRLHAVIDGRVGEAFTDISAPGVRFSPDGKRSAYLAKRDGTWTLVVDGRPGPAFNAIRLGRRIFSTSSKRVAYAALRAGAWKVLVDGRSQPAHQGVLKGSVAISPDDRYVAWTHRRAGRWHLVLNGREVASYDDITAGGCAHFLDPTHLRCLVYNQKRFHHVTLTITPK